MSDINRIQTFDISEIERIVSRRSTQEGTEYLIKWKNHSESENTWEHLSKLIEDKAGEAIVWFESQCKDTPPKDVTVFLMAYKGAELQINEDKEIIDSEKDTENLMDEDWMNNYGSLPKDSIKRIIKLEIDHSNKKLYAHIEWNERNTTRFKPPNSLVRTVKLKKYCLSLYLEFLERIMYTKK